MLPICHDDEAQFLAGQEFLNDDFAPRRAEFTAKHGVGCGERLMGRCGDDDSLARSQSARLDDDRRSVLHDIARIEGGAGERCMLGRRDAVALQELLAEGLGAFELRRCGARPKTFETGGRERIDDAGDERRFGSDDGEIDALGTREGDERGYVHGRDVRVAHARFHCGAGVARRDDDFCDVLG